MGVANWFSQLADIPHKLVRRRFGKRTVFAKQEDNIWTADLVDISPFSRSNNGYKYLLTVFDVFSKCGWIVLLKCKIGREVVDAFRKLVATATTLPSRLCTDKGTEFYNQQLMRVLTANNPLFRERREIKCSRTMEPYNEEYNVEILYSGG